MSTAEAGGTSPLEEIEILEWQPVDEAGAPLGAARAAGDDEPEPSAPPVPMVSQAEYDALTDRLARLMAEFENYRRRRDREAADAATAGAERVLRALLPVLDNLERASEAGAGQSGGGEALASGVALIVKQFHAALFREGVEPVATRDLPFDPRVHEALAIDQTPDADGDNLAEPRVSDEIQRGYTFRGRLLRPALVRVTGPGLADRGAADACKEDRP